MKTIFVKEFTILFLCIHFYLLLISPVNGQENWLVRANIGVFDGYYPRDGINYSVDKTFINKLSSQIEIERKLNKNYVIGAHSGFQRVSFSGYNVYDYSEGISIDDAGLRFNNLIFGMQLGALLNKQTTFYVLSGAYFIMPEFTGGSALNIFEGKISSLDGKNLNTRVTGYVGLRLQHNVFVNEKTDITISGSPRYIFKENVIENEFLFEAYEFHIMVGCQYKFN
jgi:hypothetical protein